MAFINYLTQIHLESGAIQQLRAECARLHITKPLVVTDAGVVAAGLLGKLQNALDGLPHAVFADTPPNPNEAAVNAGVAAYKASGCDGIVALGGGSSLDCGKGIAILATHPGQLTDYATILGGAVNIGAHVAPLIAVPTTAGTGSEVARGAILIVHDGRKLGFHNWHLMPKSAILDPDLTLGLPPLLTAATGMDAIAHCMETFVSAAFNPPADGIALDGLERGWRSLPLAVADGSHAAARLDLMSASMQGALAFQKGLGAVHSLSHSLGGLNPKLHHGTLNALFLPAVLRFNAFAPSVQAERRMSRMAVAMGLHGSAAGQESNGQASAEHTNAERIAQAILDRNAALDLPSGLTALGVTEGDFDAIIHHAMLDHCHKTNPRVATAQEYRELLAQSM